MWKNNKKDYFANYNENLNPAFESLKISIVFLGIGVFLILFFNNIINLFYKDNIIFENIQKYKEIFFVLIIAIIVYFLNRNNIILIKSIIKRENESYKDLSSAHEQLVAVEEELREQYNELQKSKASLFISEQRYELAVEGANDGIWDWEIKTNKYYFSLNFKEYFGYEEGEIENTIEGWKRLLHPEDKDMTIKIMEEYFKKGYGVYKDTYRLRCKNGSYRWILSHGKALWNKDGTPIRFAGSHTDITEQLNLQEYLRLEKALSENIMNNVSVIIAIWESNGKIKRINPFAEELFGYCCDEVKDKSWMEFVIPKENKIYTKFVFEKIVSGKSLINYESQLISKNGKIIDVLWNSSAIYDSHDNITEIISVGTNITERKRMEKKLHTLAYYDPLTGLPNRTMIEKQVNIIIEEHKDSEDKFAFIYLDIDNFKHVNDTLGHITGDALLKHISQIMKNNLKFPNLIGRLSGDEFVIILVEIKDRMDVVNKLENLLKDLRTPWMNDGNELFISVSMGIVIYPEDGMDYSTLLKHADTAMFNVKEKGKNGYGFYTKNMKEKAYNYLNIVNQLHKAINNKEFVLFYQPLVDLHSKKIIGVEALIRWNHPEKGIIFPMEFIPFAEEIGLIYEIGDWVLKTALYQKKKWEEEGYKDLQVSINLSSTRLKKGNLAYEISQILDELNLTGGIIIEITETAVMEDMDMAIEILQSLKKKGIKIALDDFGTGYSSLTYLRNLPIDVLKIDREFIKGVTANSQKEEIVKSVVKLGRALDLKVVAEGIETKSELKLLKEYGCDVGQGYLFSKPVEAKEIEKLLKNKNVYTF
ncbi:EAL domain-containing protein [uncultured Clostridium sp.]|uniref:sensor domain-containing protein n=1 Tax=uncultured Clostridium sp. TaxID=59620 RepID=UPI0028E45343|nr:EAL domain-containing protein [uncultured Clostridium sp.]